ncbi:PSP1 C-terminal domain-containing protein, partial [Bacillus altitudinis]|uniref:PSP1 C-terminal domain-containing protein n=1 Tax=Bacillus altitudinis TaxID=293387 RepID=UPI003B529373
KLTQHPLQINLVHLQFTFHPNNLIFYFTPHPRLHFPHLLNHLPSIFNTTIQLPQIPLTHHPKILPPIPPSPPILSS